MAVCSATMPEDIRDLRIAICGGGVAGISAGLGLKLAGFRSVDIYESVSQLGEVGAGINVGESVRACSREAGFKLTPQSRKQVRTFTES